MSDSDTVMAIGERVIKMLKTYKEEFSHSPETKKEAKMLEKIWNRYIELEEKMEKICEEYEL